jgi:hypothetical protein
LGLGERIKKWLRNGGIIYHKVLGWFSEWFKVSLIIKLFNETYISRRLDVNYTLD